MKPWWKSKTIVFGALSVVAGSLVQFTDIVKLDNPGEVPAWMLIVSGVATVVLRYVTKEPIQ